MDGAQRVHRKDNNPICDEDCKNAVNSNHLKKLHFACKSMADMITDKAEAQWESDPVCLKER